MTRRILLQAVTLLPLSLCLMAGDDNERSVRRVLVISIDGMHSLDMALWIKANPASNFAQLSARGIQYTNATSTRPVDSIPATVGIFSGASPALGGMYYDDAYNRAWYPPSNLTCAGKPGTVIDLKQGIDVNPLLAATTIDPAKLPRRLVNGICSPVYPHDMIRVNTVFEVVKKHKGRTAYSEKRPSYDFLNGPSGTGVDDLYAPEINDPLYGITVLQQTKNFDMLRVASILNEINGKDHAGTKPADVPVLFGMNFQSVNAAKKTSPSSGYADSLSDPDANLTNALTFVDGAIGSFVGALSSRGLLNSTAIIITAKHAESPLDPSHRFIELNSAIATALGSTFPASGYKITEKTAALIWVFDQTKVPAMVAALSNPTVQKTLNVSQILSGESLKLLFPDPLTDPAVPDIVVIPNNGTNYEPTLSFSAASVYAEHGGFNENETHVPLLLVAPGVSAGKVMAPVTTTQIAPTILSLLKLDPSLLTAVKTEGVAALPATPVKSED